MASEPLCRHADFGNRSVGYVIALVAWLAADRHDGTLSSGSHTRTVDATHESAGIEIAPPFWTVLPFVVLLAGIAVLPLIPHTSHWWESNLNRFKVAGGLALVTMAYYAFLHQRRLKVIGQPIMWSRQQTGACRLAWSITILANAMLQEFVPFIVLLFSLYTISGGIRIAGDLQARPTTNAVFMGVGPFAGQLHRHDGGRDAAHSPAAGNQSRTASMWRTRSCFSFSSRAIAAAACCRLAIRRCFSAIWKACPSCGRCGCGRSGCL